jgi:hypothetical protein
MIRENLFARVASSYGTRCLHAYFAASAPAGSRMTPVASSTPHVLQRLVSAGSIAGVRLDTLNANEHRALSDIESLGLRLDRTRRADHVVLVGTVEVIDQRTFIREVA